MKCFIYIYREREREREIKFYKRVMLEIQTFLQKKFINNCCGEWLLVNEKVMLKVGQDKNQ